MSATSTSQRLATALEVPLLRFLGVSAIDPEDGRAGVSMLPTADVMNAVEAPHAGAISTILEIAAYLALLPDLVPDEEAVSHALFVGYLARADTEKPLIATGRLLRRGRRLAFVATELRQGDRLLATAQVTKSVYLLAGDDGRTSAGGR